MKKQNMQLNLLNCLGEVSYPQAQKRTLELRVEAENGATAGKV